MPSSASTSPTVYFDGACPVCTREIALYRRQPGAEGVCWVDVSACSASTLGADLSREAALARLHVRRADGSLVSGARAFVALWAALPRTAWLARALGSAPIVAVLEVGYQAFLRLRRMWRKP